VALRVVGTQLEHVEVGSEDSVLGTLTYKPPEPDTDRSLGMRINVAVNIRLDRSQSRGCCDSRARRDGLVDAHEASGSIGIVPRSAAAGWVAHSGSIPGAGKPLTGVPARQIGPSRHR